jgi:Tol biopolymer transport system component
MKMKLRKLYVAIAKVTMLGGLIAGSLAINAELVEYHSADYFESSQYDTKSYVRISSNGRYIAYSDNHDLSHLYPDTPQVYNINLFDRQAGTNIELLNGVIDSNCYTVACPKQWDMSRDGKYLVFESKPSTLLELEGDANNFTDIYLLNIASGEISLVTGGIENNKYGATISSTGKYITYYGQKNFVWDFSFVTYVYNVATGTTTIVDSVPGPYVKLSNPDISADGKFVLSDSRDGSSFSLMNTENQSQTLLSDSGDGRSFSTLSADGRFALFHKGLNDYADWRREYVPIENRILTGALNIHDTKTGETTELSIATDGSNSPINVSLGQFSVSADGRFITFASPDNGLVEGDVDDEIDIFVYDRIEHQVVRVNEGIEYGPWDSTTAMVGIDISEDGHYIVFNNYVVTNPFFSSSEYCEGYEEFKLQ